MAWLHFNPGERTPVSILQEAGQAPEPVWMQKLKEKSSAPVSTQIPVAQFIVRHYTELPGSLYVVTSS
jgi:hypothetical protein